MISGPHRGSSLWDGLREKNRQTCRDSLEADESAISE